MSQSYRLSQLAPFPHIKGLELGKTIGHGGFGVVKSAVVRQNGSSVVIAVKFVHLRMAEQQRVTPEMLAREAFIQKECKHKNIIRMFDFGVDANWAWMAMEMASNGELFDKIEPDKGVDEEVAQFYFLQLINAVQFIHGRGVAHRDIKPENLVLDSSGNLKLTDFGLASVFRKKNGPKRLATTACGSPPYLAPEVVTQRYDPEMADIWSCGVVLFVLLTGAIAWEMPHRDDPDYEHFVRMDGKVNVGPWKQVPFRALSLLRKVLNPDPEKRISEDQILKDPWVAKKSCFMDSHGMCKDTLHLTTRLLVSLYVSLSDEEYDKVNLMSTQQSSASGVRRQGVGTQQPMRYLMDDTAPRDETGLFKENYQPRGFSASQVEYTEHTKRRKLRTESKEDDLVFSLISKDPAALQFIDGGREAAISAKMSQLQHSGGKRAPELFAVSLTRFFSVSPLKQILLTILEALLKLGLRNSDDYDDNESLVESLSREDSLEGTVTIPINTRDTGRLPVIGNIKVTKMADNLDVRKVEFVKIKADPLEWRRVFRRVTVLCRDIVYVEKGESSAKQDPATPVKTTSTTSATRTSAASPLHRVNTPL